MDEIALTDTETRYFGDLFLCCDVEKTGKIPVLKATELFRSANLSNDVIRQITSLSGVSQTALHISRSQFYACLKLIAAYQASIQLRSEVISSSLNLPLPRFSWKDSPPLNRPVPPTVAASNPSTVGTPATGPVGVEINGLATTTSIREVYHSPDLIELARVRDLQNDTTNSDLQSTDSEVEHNESGSGRVNRRHRGGSPEAWSTNSDSPTPTNSVAERPWAKDTLWQGGPLGDEHRQLLGTEEESSDRHSSDDDNDTDLDSIYQITSEQREYYNKQFKAVQPDPNGLLSGHIARVFFEKSRIPVEELRRIWQLCDVTRDGALSLAEFTAAMHLVVLRRNNIQLPPVLPPCLNPNVLNQSSQAGVVEPPEADLLHLDDDKTDSISIKSATKENDYKRMISVHSEKSNVMNLSTLSTTSQTSISSKQNVKSSTSPTSVGGHSKNRSVSNSPPPESVTPPNARGKELIKDWTNQSREWTKFTESPTSNVSSPGPKPVNFDMQRTAQAVVSDPQILHPVPLRVTPVGGTEILDEETTRILRKSETLAYEGSGLVVLRENETSPKQNSSSQQTNGASGGNHSQQHRDSLPGNDLRAIQRPQPKKIPTKSVGALPPPPQREPSVGSGSNDAIEITCSSSSIVATSLISKKEPPPLPPPRPHRHARSSSLDLNKLKMGGTGTGGPATQDITSQNSFDVQVDTSNSGFADFAHFPETSKVAIDDITHHTVGDSVLVAPPPPRPIISSLQTSSQRVSAFEVYRKPNTPRNSQSPDSLQIIQQPYPQIASTNSSSTVSIISGTEYDKRVAAISETLRHVSFKHDKNVVEVLRHLREQNVLLLRLCNDLSEELLTVQQRKEEMRSKLESVGGSSGGNLATAHATGNGNISTNVTGGSGSSGVHSNV